MCSVEHGGVTRIDKELDHIALKASLPALRTGLLVGQPLGQAAGEGGMVDMGYSHSTSVTRSDSLYVHAPSPCPSQCS